MAGEQMWSGRSEIVTPAGVRISVVIEVPAQIAGADVLEITEHAQTAATRLQAGLRSADESPNSKVFLKECPF